MHKVCGMSTGSFLGEKKCGESGMNGSWGPKNAGERQRSTMDCHSSPEIQILRTSITKVWGGRSKGRKTRKKGLWTEERWGVVLQGREKQKMESTTMEKNQKGWRDRSWLSVLGCQGRMEGKRGGTKSEMGSETQWE